MFRRMRLLAIENLLDRMTSRSGAASDVGAKGSSAASGDTLAGSASVGGTAAVPEPSSLVLALLAAIGFGVVIAAQNRKAAR